MSYETPQFGDSPDSSEPLLPPEDAMPYLDLIIDDVSHRLTWENTLVRKFAVGSGDFDHMLHQVAEDQSIYIFLNHSEAGVEIKGHLEENSFPIRYDPILDDGTIELYARMESKSIDSSPSQIFPD